MTLADIVAVMSGPDRVRITKGSNELFAGYLGNLVHMAEYEALMAEEVTRIKEKVDITHKRYKELGLMQPLHPEETPNYSFSDLQLTIYREIILRSEEYAVAEIGKLEITVLDMPKIQRLLKRYEKIQRRRAWRNHARTKKARNKTWKKKQ